MRAMVLGDREIMKSSQILSKREQVFCCLQQYFLDCGEYCVGILVSMHSWQGIAPNVLILLPYQLGYLKDSNAAAHSVDTDIS